MYRKALSLNQLMPVRLLSDQPNDHFGPRLFFYELYQKLWRRERCDEDAVRREIYKEVEGKFPGDERTSASDSDSVNIDDRVPIDTFHPKILDISSLPNKPTLRTATTVLVRQEYEEAMSNLGQNDRNVVLSGQPGIGKTVFLLYALVERLLKRQPTLYTDSPRLYFLFRKSGVYMFNETDVGGWLVEIGVSQSHGGDVPGGVFDFAKEPGWVLFDSNQAQKFPPKLPWKVILASSPASSRYKEWAKQKRAQMYFMKPWDWQEICAAALLQKQPRDHDQLWRMYSLFGPSARVVFESTPEQRFGKIEFALTQVKDPSQLFPTIDIWDETISNALVVVGPRSDDSRSAAVARIATPYIMDRTMVKVKEVMSAKMREMYTGFLSNTVFRVPAGAIFETFAHRVLGRCDSPRLLRRRLLTSTDDTTGGTADNATDTTVDTLDFTMKSPAALFENIQGGFKERTYYRPLQSNLAGVDAFTIINRTLVCLQFAISHQHPVAIKGLRLIRNAVPMANWEQCVLVFVVPPDTEPDFKRQPTTPPADRRQWSEYMPQFVASLSIDELFESD